jgi:hypothetical protein
MNRNQATNAKVLESVSAAKHPELSRIPEDDRKGARAAAISADTWSARTSRRSFGGTFGTGSRVSGFTRTSSSASNHRP